MAALLELKEKSGEPFILVANSSPIEQKSVFKTLEFSGYPVKQCVDAEKALKMVKNENPSLIIIDEKMKPNGGFDFLNHLRLFEKELPVIMISVERTTDLLIQAGKYNIQHVLEEPVEQTRLLEAVRRVSKARRITFALRNTPKKPVHQQARYSREELMRRAIALGEQNAKTSMGGPFGAVVADQEGHILGEGANSVKSQCDPVAHAEVIAIRKAAERLNNCYLDSCVLYCSCVPTMMGQGLIYSTGIKEVYYALTHMDVGAKRTNDEGILGEVSKPLDQRDVPYLQMLREEALDIAESWKQLQL